MEKAEVNGWLTRYVEAWKTCDREQIAGLYSDDIVYRYHPYDEPIRGRDTVVDSWLGTGEYSDEAWAPDEPGTFEATYKAVAVDGDVAVATGSSTYLTAPGGSVKMVYDNCFVMRFDGSGQCSEFTEWFMKRPSPDSG